MWLTHSVFNINYIFLCISVYLQEGLLLVQEEDLLLVQEEGPLLAQEEDLLLVEEEKDTMSLEHTYRVHRHQTRSRPKKLKILTFSWN